MLELHNCFSLSLLQEGIQGAIRPGLASTNQLLGRRDTLQSGVIQIYRHLAPTNTKVRDGCNRDTPLPYISVLVFSRLK